MFTRIQALRFRCLRDIDQRLGRFATLVGPNASGKTTFLDVVALLGELAEGGGKVIDAVRERHTEPCYQQHPHALVVLDYEGSGAQESPEALEARLDSELRPVWGSDAKAIAIVPELETWVWGSDNALKPALAWPHEMSIRAWVAAAGFKVSDEGKPDPPR